MRPSLNLDLPDPDWLVLLKKERASGKSVSQIAREIDMKRPSVSMLLNGTYPAQSLDLVSRKHGRRILKIYADGVACPHLRRTITPDTCATLAGAPMSTSHPEKLNQWAACRRCDLNPLKGSEDD